MKSKKILWMVLGAVAFGFLLSAASAGAARTETTRINADKDTYVYSASPGSNFGTLTTFYAGNSSSSAGYTAYFHFPYSPVPSYLETAEIEIPYSDVFGSSFFADVYFVSVDSWSETTMTWNNKPSGGLSDIYSLYATDPSYTTTITVNVESYISDTNGVSLCINCSGYSTSYLTGWTREASSSKPVMVYTYLVSSFGIPGYDVVFLVLSSLGMVAFLGYKYRTRRTE